MNAEQARDLFSAYLEDALEPALRQQMDRTLAGNPALMQEFREFKEVCHALELTRDEEIAVPGHLNARIAAVLDDALAAKQNRPVLQLFKWKPATVSLAAGLAILAAGAAIFSPAGGKFVAGFFGSGPSEVAPVSKMSWQNDELTIQYRTAKVDELLIRKGVDGEVWQTVTLGPDMVRQPILNKTTEPLVVELDVAGTPDDLVVVIPGETSEASVEGEGDVVMLASQLAERYGMPVEVRARDMALTYRWTMPNVADALELAGDLRKIGLTISRGENGILTLSQ
jgi:hypothetical protein